MTKHKRDAQAAGHGGVKRKYLMHDRNSALTVDLNECSRKNTLLVEELRKARGRVLDLESKAAGLEDQVQVLNTALDSAGKSSREWQNRYIATAERAGRSLHRIAWERIARAFGRMEVAG